MPVVNNNTLPEFTLPGLVHRTVAGIQNGLSGLEVWMETFEPGATIPAHRHPCEQVIVILQGSGRIASGQDTVDFFGPNSTLIIPRDVVHQVVNTSSGPMTVVAQLNMTPVQIISPENQPIPVPWEPNLHYSTRHVTAMMGGASVVKNDTLQHFTVGGLVHRTVAGIKNGLSGLEVWMQTYEPGAGTPFHYQTCEEVIVILKGSGRIIIEGDTFDFGPNSTLIVPPKVVHQLINTGSEMLLLVAALNMTPVGIYKPDNQPLPVPWEP